MMMYGFNDSNYLKIKGVEHLYPDETQTLGIATISKIEVDMSHDPLHNLRAIRDGHSFATMADGRYVRLHVNGQLVMSDTLMERRTNQDFVIHAHGRVLIAGLGLGLVLPSLLANPAVSEVIVVEKYQDVITLVAEKHAHSKLKIVCADIFEYKTNEKFNCIYFDIWSEISEDNLADIRKLHAKFKFKLDRSDDKCFMDSWMAKFLRSERAKERRSNYWY